MVKLHAPETIVTNGKIMPVMRKHSLRVIKEAPSFPEGETIDCYIALYSGGRYCVWDSSWGLITNYHVFDSEDQLHEHFDEN